MSGRMNSPKKATPKGKGKRLIPHVQHVEVSPSPIPKSVTFNHETVETSIGGTQSTGQIKPEADILHPLSPMDNNIMSRFVSKFTEKLGLNVGKENNKMKEKIPQPIDTSTPDSSIDLLEEKVKEPIFNLMKKPEDLPPRVKKSDESVKKTLLEVDTMLLPPPSTPEQFRTPTKVARRHTLESRIFQTPDCYRVVQTETPRKYDLSYDDLSDLDTDEDSCTSVMVAVRVRPLSQRELSDPNVKTVVAVNGNETTVTAESGLTYRFAYDFSFWSCDRHHSQFASQETVYDNLAQPLLGKAYEGYNTCLFAYGQTGSGKSYSIMGHGTETGIIPRFCEELFSRAENLRDKDKVKISVEISFFEIYNEKIHDLLASCKDKGGKKPTLKVREHPVLGPYVEGLSTFVVNSFEDVKGWITLGNKNRATAATGMNDKSSRSHSVFTIVLTQTRTERLEGQDHDSSINSKINLVDLAGSERQSQAQTSGERLREGANINKSLMTLGKVIALLSDRSTSKKKTFIPYRDSVLTWLLKESLGGNSKTAMIATISPANHHTEETLSTLRYAKQARSIVNVVRVNEDPKARIIRELRQEIEKLRGNMCGGSVTDDSHISSLTEIALLRDKLLAKEREMDEMSRSWQERLRQSEARKIAESKQLEKSGVALKVDNKLPNLVNLNEDPQLSEMLLYVIKEGQTRVGRMSEKSKHDIQLSGALIADNHCIINNVEGVINMTPIGDAPTYVNGNLITEPTILHHADRVILGGDHYFRFNHPMEVDKTKKTSLTSSDIKDFEFAKQELLRVQEARLQSELEEARKQAQQELVEEVEKAKKEAAKELNQQKSGYEDKLAELEKALRSQSQEVRKAEEGRQEAEDIINNLKKQKMILEQEVKDGRRRQLEEAEAAVKVANKVSISKSRLLELLETEKVKAKEDLERVRQKRSETNTPSRHQQVPETMTGRKDLYKVALLLREANKISQFLKKNTTFSREDVLEEDKVKPVIKVTNTKHNICTYWTVGKFEEKVLQMRDLYQNEGESSADDDEVFHDPGDNWERDPHLVSPLNSPQLMSSYFRSPLSSCRSSQLNSTGSLSFKRLSLGSVGNHPNLGNVAKLCKDLVSKISEKHSGTSPRESFPDKILRGCHDIRQSVSAIMDATGGPDDDVTLQERLVMQLGMALQLVSATCTLWSQLYQGCGSSQLTELLHRLCIQLRTVSGHVSMFLQGCENDLASVVAESGTKIIDSLLKMCRHTGELSLLTDVTMASLDTRQDQRPQLARDICQAFLTGCDSFVDKSLQDGIHSLEETESRAQTLVDKAASNLKFGDIPQHVEIVVSTSKVLAQKCQEVQVELDTTMRDSSESQTPQFFHRSFRRSQGLLSHISSLVDTAGLLVQSAEPVLDGSKPAEVGRIYRCAELVQKATARLLKTSGTQLQEETSDPEDPDVSVLSEMQLEHLEFAGQEVSTATRSLMEHLKKSYSPEKWTVSPGQGNKLLPGSPATSVPLLSSTAKRAIITTGSSKS